MDDRTPDQITDDEMQDEFEPECLASHCPPSMYTDCEWPRCVNPNLIP